MKVSNEKKSFENIFPIILHSILGRTSSALFSMYLGTDKAGFIQTSFYQIFGMITVGRSKQSAISKKILTHSIIRRISRIRTKGMDYSHLEIILNVLIRVWIISSTTSSL